MFYLLLVISMLWVHEMYTLYAVMLPMSSRFSFLIYWYTLQVLLLMTTALNVPMHNRPGETESRTRQHGIAAIIEMIHVSDISKLSHQHNLVAWISTSYCAWGQKTKFRLYASCRNPSSMNMFGETNSYRLSFKRELQILMPKTICSTSFLILWSCKLGC